MGRVGVLTGGGDTQALNATIYGLVTGARELGWDVVGIEKGYDGLIGKTVKVDDFTGVSIVNLTDVDLEKIPYIGGSILKSSRTNPDTPEKIKKCASVIKKNSIDYLVPIGGDDTNKGALALYEAGFDLDTINKTMDNDIKGTLFCLGFPTAAARATMYAGSLPSTLYTNRRDGLFYVFGRKAGWAPLATASWEDPEDPDTHYHRVLVPEMGEITEDKIIGLYEDVKSRHGFAQLGISEGVKIKDIMDREDQLKKRYPEIVDQYDHIDLKALNVPGYVAELIRDYRGLKGKDREKKVMFRRLDYFLRSGQPTDIDRELAIAAGRHAIELLADGITGRMVNITKDNVIEGYGVGDISLKDVSGGRTLEESMFDSDTCTPTENFIEYVWNFVKHLNPERYRLFNKPLPQVKQVAT